MATAAKFELTDDSVVVIVGTGAGGGVLANELAQKGVRVVALEAGGRYLTPYAFVRAMRRAGPRAPLRVDAQAVRLLTIHGAKGLEADAVLLGTVALLSAWATVRRARGASLREKAR